MSQLEGIKTDFEDVSQVVKKVRVEVPKEVIEKRLEDSYEKLKKTAKIKGFRPGKAPISMIKSRYRESVVGQLEEDLVREGSLDAIRERKMKAVAITRIEDGKYREGEEFTFTAHIEVLPEVDPQGYMGIEISREEPEVKEEDLEKEVEMVREAHAVYKPVERESREGDYLDIGFRTKEGDKVLSDVEEDTYVIGAPSNLGEEFDKQVTGKSVGDVADFEITYPDDHEMEAARGKTIRYEIKVKSIKEKELPAVDDDLARMVPEVENLEDLRNKIKENMIKYKDGELKAKQKEEIVNALIEKNPMEVPESAVEDEIRGQIHAMENRMRAQGVDFDPSKINIGALKEKYRDGAEKAVKISILFNTIAVKEDISVSEKELEGELRGLSERYNISFENVASYYDDEERKRSLKTSILETRVMDFLLKNAVTDAEENGSGKEVEK